VLLDFELLPLEVEPELASDALPLLSVAGLAAAVASTTDVAAVFSVVLDACWSSNTPKISLLNWPPVPDPDVLLVDLLVATASIAGVATTLVSSVVATLVLLAVLVALSAA